MVDSSFTNLSPSDLAGNTQWETRKNRKLQQKITIKKTSLLVMTDHISTHTTSLFQGHQILQKGLYNSSCTDSNPVFQSLPQTSRDNVVIVISLIHESILETRVPYPHQVVKTNAHQHYVMHSVWLLPQHGEQTLESVLSDAKGIFHNLPSPRNSVVKDSLKLWQIVASKGLHRPNP